MLIWITGLSGSGKSTIAQALYKKIKPQFPSTILLDGDTFREILGNDLSHTPQARIENARRIARMCHFLVNQKINVICATMSLFQEIHKFNRDNIQNYIEVFVECSKDELIRRDQKKLYSQSIQGKIKNVVGIDLPYDKPLTPELIINNNNMDQLDNKANQILSFIQENI